MLDALLALAEPLARRPPKELIVAGLVGAAEELEAATGVVRERRAALLEGGVSARAAAFVSHRPAEDIVRIAVEQNVDLVLIDGPAELLDDPYSRAPSRRSVRRGRARLGRVAVGPGARAVRRRRPRLGGGRACGLGRGRARRPPTARGAGHAAGSGVPVFHTLPRTSVVPFG
jgi:hypothetical protein